jgi:ribosomal protein S18 acetylase RimI-like enzyme
MMEIQIRSAVPDDEPNIRQVQRLTWLDTYPNEAAGITRADIQAMFDESTPEIQRRREVLRNVINTGPQRHFWVAENGTDIVGMCHARKDEEIRHIQALYVLPQYQGQGIGKRLMQAALEWLGTDQPVTLNVAAYNSNAIAFYKLLGFVPNENPGHSSVPALPSGAVIPHIEMIKR